MHYAMRILYHESYPRNRRSRVSVISDADEMCVCHDFTVAWR